MDTPARTVWIRNGTVGVAPSGGRVALGHAVGGSEPSATLFVLRFAGNEGGQYTVRLGETFPFENETWRLADMHFESSQEYFVAIRRVDANEPQDPPRGHIWQPAEFQPYGTLTREQCAELEAQLGVRLPSAYSDWLKRTNGARPAGTYQLARRHFLMTPERPLFGMHPNHPAFDLVTVQRTRRDPFLPADHLVIATPGGAGGLLVVRPDDLVSWLPPDAMTGRVDPADRIRFLEPCGRDVSHFIGRLTRYEPNLPPARGLS